MNAKIRVVSWLAFGVATVVTGFVASRLWMLPSYELLLSLLAIVSAGLGVWVLRTSNFSYRSVLLVALGLVIGQWWLTEKLILLIGWSVVGFAP